MKVCIVGAGVAGLQISDTLASSGHECHIFEREASIGGVWRDNYDGYALQVPMELYEFPDFAAPEAHGTFPDGKSVLKYIEGYVDERNLMLRCTFHFSERVKELKPEGDAWRVVTDVDVYAFDYCVICTGMYDTPYKLVETAIHSSEFVDAASVAGKSVVVVGSGKSAIDCAVASSRHASKVTLASRKMHWPVPRRIAGLVPFKWGTYSRLGHFLLPVHWNVTTAEGWAHGALGCFKWAIWRILERVFAWQFSLEHRPSTPLETDLFAGGQVLTAEFSDAVKAQRILLRPLDDAILESADVVVCATGFRKDYTIFDDETRSKLDIQEDGLWLYKNIISPRIKRLAFIGSEVSTFNNILTHHIQSQWLQDAIEKGLPDEDAMLSEIEIDRMWKRSWMPPTPSRAAMVQLHMTKYHDMLMLDMGRQPVRARWWEWAVPHTAADYSRKTG